MPAVLAFQDTETLGRLLGCHPSELRHETPPARAPAAHTTPLATAEFSCRDSRDHRQRPRRREHHRRGIRHAGERTLAASRTIPPLRGRRRPGGRPHPQGGGRRHGARAAIGRPHRRRHVPPLADARGALRHVGRQLDRHQALRVRLGFRAAYDQAPLRRPLPPTLRLSRIRGPIPGQGVVGHTRSVTCHPACAPRP